MMDYGSVDVVIPSYQETESLLRAVNSALSQGQMIGTVFVVDDGSDEETRAFISHHVQGKLNVKVIYLTHSSHPGFARNIGIAQCTSQWVAFLDSDDIWEENKLKRQLEFADTYKLDFVSSNAFVQELNIVRGTYFEPRAGISLDTKRLILDNLVINSTALVRLNLVVDLGGYVHDYHLRGVEDYSTWLRLSTSCSMGYLDEPLVTYTVSTNSFSRGQTPMLRLYSLIDFFYWLKPMKKLSLRVYLLYKIMKYFYGKDSWREN